MKARYVSHARFSKHLSPIRVAKKFFGVRIKQLHLGIPKSVTQSESAGKNAFLTGFKREVN